MNIFITGITGLIGRALTARLREQQHTISGLTRDAHKASKLLPKSVSLVESFEEAQGFMPDAVINLAGEPIADKRWSPARKEALFNSRVALTNELVEWMSAMEQPPEVLISGSAVGFYGRHNEQLIDEQSEPHDEFTHQLCDQWEQAALKASDFSRVCLLRTGLVVAPKGGFLSKMLLPFKLGLGGRIASGEQGMSWIHLHDMVEGIVYLLNNHQQQGVFNFTAPHPVSNREFTKTLASVLHRPAFFPVPQWVLKLGLGEMSDLLTTGQFVVPKALQESGYQFRFTRLQPALEDAIRNSK